jgi:ferredoxin-NADP reductase
MDITRPTSLTGTIPVRPDDQRITANSAGWGIGPVLAGARAARDHNRCQAMGGARARNSAA